MDYKKLNCYKEADNTSVRCFSEGVPAVETEAQKRVREALGGENDGESREWARYVKRFGEPYSENLDIWLMLRRDQIFAIASVDANGNESIPVYPTAIGVR
ncbi:MAG: hypothetical protein LBQ86_03315 [Holophagales bacterium]|jgi:hypothetical protein|nr:hypothetical protein [Holophagales bacterium]